MVDAYGILNVTRFLQSFEARDIENAGEREGEREREREKKKYRKPHCTFGHSVSSFVGM